MDIFSLIPFYTLFTTLYSLVVASAEPGEDDFEILERMMEEEMNGQEHQPGAPGICEGVTCRIPYGFLLPGLVSDWLLLRCADNI